MHELAVCQALLDRVEGVAAARGACGVTRVAVRVGPLSGVEPRLLARAFTVARAGTCAHAARLEIEAAPVRVACTECGAQSEVAANRLLCAACGGYRIRLIAGDELQLTALDLQRLESGTAAPAARPEEEPDHV